MKKILALLYGLLPLMATAQPELTLGDAVSIALENNYSIRLVATELATAENNVHIGNAGMLPTLSADASSNAGIQNTMQTLLSGETREVRGNNTRSSSYGASLNWTIFDGLQMFVRYEQLKALKELGEANLKAAILSTVYDVVSGYFDLVQQHQLIKATQTALELSAYRYQIAENRYQIGRASKLEVLAASVDLNTDTTNLLRQQDEFRRMKIRLNELLARDVNTEFVVSDTIIIARDLRYDQLIDQARQLNPSLQSAIINQRISELELRRVKGARYPEVRLSSAYTRSRSSTQLGFSTSSRNNGFSYGVSASMNLFNGFLQRRNEQNAKIAVEAAEIEVERVNREIEAQLMAAYETYLMNLELVRLEERNRDIAQENMNITLEKFTLGSIAPLEFREAQRNYVDANARYSTAQYQAKLAEISLRQIAGALEID